MKKIFVDLDSVIVDFDKQLADLLDKPLVRGWDFGDNPKVWKKIKDAGEDFWADMPWMPDGHELWNYIKKFKPTVLTAPTKEPSSKTGKKLWLKDNLPGVPYIIDKQKQEHAKEGYILIDDREKNIRKWEDAGGTGVLHTGAKSTIKKLRKIMEDKEKEASSMDYSKYLIYTPKDGGEYYGLSIPKDVTPPKEGVKLNIGGVDLIVFTVRTPMDIAKGRGGPVADSMLENGIGWRVNCLPPKHEYIRRASMYKAIESLDAASDALEAMGRVKEAFHLDKVADRFEDFLKAQKEGPGSPGVKEMFPKVQMKKLLWGSGDKRLQTVKDVLENILRRRTGTNIPREKLVDVENVLKALRAVSITEFSDQSQIDAAKKDILNKAFGIEENISELVGLLFAPITNKMERMHNENEINRIAKPYLLSQRKDPFQSDFGRSRVFQEMARRADSMDLSRLSDEHVRIVNAYLSKVSETMEKYASLELYLTQFIDSIMKHRPNTGKVMEWLSKGINTLYPVPPDVDKQKVMESAWKKALSTIVSNPKNLLDRLKGYNLGVSQIPADFKRLKEWSIAQIAKALKLKSGFLAENTMSIEEWAQLTGMSVPEFISFVDSGSSASNTQSPSSDKGNPVVMNNGLAPAL